MFRVFNTSVCNRYFDKFVSVNCTTIRRSSHVLPLPHLPPNKQRIVLMGPPGAGKSTIARILSNKWGLPLCDMDNDILEKAWNMPVSKKLADIGDYDFVEEEGQTAMSADIPTGVILSLSGSSPIYRPLMDKLTKDSFIIFLDVDAQDIQDRMENMMTDRIVGWSPGKPLTKIIRDRMAAYERCYDLRILCERGETAKEIARKIYTLIRRVYEKDLYVSTRDLEKKRVGFNTTVVNGLATDGGLYVPKHHLPCFTLKQWERMLPLHYCQRAVRILDAWLSPFSVPSGSIKSWIYHAYNLDKPNQDTNIAPVVKLEDNIFIQEQWHGPTASFKDLSLQLLPYLFNNAISATDSMPHVVLAATSGDTGVAVMNSFKRARAELNKDFRVLAFYPKNGVSKIQEAFMVGENDRSTKAVPVEGNFDFCQTAVKRILGPARHQLEEETGAKLSSANSINWSRLVIQVVHHCNAYLDLVQQGEISFGEPVIYCIPTGNFGNILAALYAKLMGIPIYKLICASNENSILSDFFATDMYRFEDRQLIPTASPAIDILNPSNFERFLYHASNSDTHNLQGILSDLRDNGQFEASRNLRSFCHAHMLSASSEQSEYMLELKNVLSRTGYLIDPHTSVARVAIRKQSGLPDVPIVISGVAHFGKFADEVGAVLGLAAGDSFNKKLSSIHKLCRAPHMHPSIEKIIRTKLPQPTHPVVGNYNIIKQAVADFAQ